MGQKHTWKRQRKPHSTVWELEQDRDRLRDEVRSGGAQLREQQRQAARQREILEKSMDNARYTQAILGVVLGIIVVALILLSLTGKLQVNL